MPDPYSLSNTFRVVGELLDWRLNNRLAELHTIAVLEDALARCPQARYVNTPRLRRSGLLGSTARAKMVVLQFRKALDEDRTEGSQAEARWQMLNASTSSIT